ncbi:MAG: 50S ribosomal protein L21e [Thermoplasmata archaeon]
MMAKSSKGIRVRTRKTLRVKPRDAGMPPVTHFLRQFAEGDKANIVIDPRVIGGQPHPRYNGLCGVISGKQGDAYKVEVVIGSKTKTLIVAPAHLEKVCK